MSKTPKAPAGGKPAADKADTPDKTARTDKPAGESGAGNWAGAAIAGAAIGSAALAAALLYGARRKDNPKGAPATPPHPEDAPETD